jgi:hypothetical protein
MEAAIADSISTTVATFVDKAVTGAMQLAFDEAVEKAVEERVHAIEDNFAAAVDKAVEDKVKAIEETMQKKIHRAARMAELKANFEAVCWLDSGSVKETNAQGVRYERGSGMKKRYSQIYRNTLACVVGSPS